MVGIVIELPRSGTSSEREDEPGGMMIWIVLGACFRASVKAWWNFEDGGDGNHIWILAYILKVISVFKGWVVRHNFTLT